MPRQPVAEAYGGGRAHRDRQIDTSRTPGGCRGWGCGLPRIDFRVVDARADIGTQPGRLIEETVCEEERRSEPARGGDDLSVVRHRPQLCRSLALRLGQ